MLAPGHPNTQFLVIMNYNYEILLISDRKYVDLHMRNNNMYQVCLQCTYRLRIC